MTAAELTRRLEFGNGQFSANVAFQHARYAAEALEAGRIESAESSRLMALGALERAHAALVAAAPPVAARPALRVVGLTTPQGA